MEHKDELAESLASAINKEFKHDYKVAYFLDGSETTPTDISNLISTGSSILDLAICNKPNGGIAVGRITDIQGLESTGKSLVGAHILAGVQKRGGVAIYIDTETSVSKEFLVAIGMDVSSMIYMPAESLEEVYEIIVSLIVKIREVDKDRLVAILVDSISGVPTRAELEGNFDKEGWATDKAIINSKAMRKLTGMIGKQRIALIFTSQLRDKLGAGWGDKFTTSGGHALPYHSSVRIRLANLGQLKDKDGNVIGMKTRATVIKNRLGPPKRIAEFNMYFDSGIDDIGSWLETLKTYKLVSQGGAWYTLDFNGDPIKFQSKDFRSKLEENPELKDYVYNLICNEIILKYKSSSLGIDDVTVEEE